TATRGYVDFLDLGGHIRHQDLNPNLIRRYLKKGIPILTGLSATYLYRCVREAPETEKDDDVGGEPVGHFVVLSGYERESRSVHVADPMADNPTEGHYYTQGIDHLICSILLGIMTYDANLLVIEPRKPRDA
ncbi:MAG: C39 family peptidase, partial [Myxococcales bacterium]|nr:C39 family peptidase [Myxococcales bacterium]